MQTNKEQSASANNASGSDENDAINEPDFSGKRILVAEDNPVNQQVAVRMLEKLGCRADVAANGREAVSLHGAQTYDLVLMDCQMPELDGYLATAQIRAAETSSRHTPVIALTAY